MLVEVPGRIKSPVKEAAIWLNTDTIVSVLDFKINVEIIYGNAGSMQSLVVYDCPIDQVIRALEGKPVDRSLFLMRP